MEKIDVLYPSGRFAYHCTPEHARQMIRSHVGEALTGRSKTKMRAVRLLEGPSRPVAGTIYSHCRPTEDNPRGVYTLRKIADLPRELFRSVELSVLLPGAEAA